MMRARPKTHLEINKFRRETLIAATIKTVAKNGIENTTIAKICTAAGVSRGLSGHYFKDKEDLLCQAYQYLQDKHGERTAAAAKAVKEGAVERLRAIVEANFASDQNTRDYRTAYLAFWTQSMTNPRIAKITSTAYRGFYASLESLLRRAMQETGVEFDPHEAAMTLIGLIDGFWLDISIAVPDVTAKSAVKIISQYLDRLLAGDDVVRGQSQRKRSTVVADKGVMA